MPVCYPVPAIASSLALAVLPMAAALAQPQAGGTPAVLVTPPPAGLSLQESSPTASRLGFPLRETPVSADVIGQGTMQELGLRSVVDAALAATGLSGAVRAGAPGVFQIRGFIENAVSLQFDGIRIGATTVYSRPYDSFNFDRIEVVRGPASALHGDSAVGGAINYVHRRPLAGPVRGEVLAQFARFDQVRLAGAVSGSLGSSTAFHLGLVTNSGESFVQSNSQRTSHLVGSLQVRLAPEATLLLEADHLNSSVDNAYWGTPLVNGALDRRLRSVNYNVAPDNLYDDQVTWLRALAEYRLAPEWTGRTSLYRYVAKREWRNFAAPRFNAAAVPQTVTIREVEDLLYDATTQGLRQEFIWSGTLARMPARLVAGVDMQSSVFDSPRFQAGPTVINVDPFNPGERSFFASSGPRNRLRYSDVGTLALFAEGAIDFGTAWRGTLGYRHDDLDVLTRFRQPADAAARETRRSFRTDSWRAALSWLYAPGQHAYASYGTGSEPVDNSAFSFIAPADLAAMQLTRARQWELGTKHQLAGGRLEFTSALYDIERRDILTADPNNPGGARQQIGQQSASGLELAAAWRVSPQWTVGANGAWVRARNDRFVSGGVNVSGRVPRMVPAHVYNAFVQWRPAPAFEFGGSARAVASVYLNDDNSVALPGWTRIDLYGRYRYSRDTDITVFLRNATDRFYADWGIQFLGAQVANVAPPRSLELMLRSRF